MAGKRWRSITLSAGVALIVCLGAAACAATTPAWLMRPVASGTSPHWDSITATRAGYVQTMLGNSMGQAALSEGGLDDLVQGYGGGYVMSVSASGSTSAGTEQHVVDVVLGVTSVRDHMQGEGYFGPAAVECYRYRIGYYSYLISYAPIACPPDSPVAEQRDAQDWAAGLVAAEDLFSAQEPGAVPTSLTRAEALLAPVQRKATAQAGGITPAGQENPSLFAVGTDRQQGNLYGTAIAALAVPLSNGTCADVRFGYAIENDGTRQLAFSGAISPWHAACTGQAALAAAVPFSADPGAGG
ncbi:MAG TPA: hypothetical protein VMA73_17845 [Streptosporangiaceae bacterium]|nr:hypothetical protein [Streptosporangiaceae bacterium]